MSSEHPGVMPHGTLQPIMDDAWFLTGSVQFKPLVRLGRNMTVLRHDGELTLINSVRLDAAGEAALEALGTVAHVVKIGNHGMDDAYYAERFGAKRWAIADAAGVIAEDGEFPIPGVDIFMFKDTNNPEAALLLKRDGGLLITCDAVQHWAPQPLASPLANLITGIFGFKKPAQIGPPWRKKMTPEGGTLRPDFERLAALPFTRLIGGHGGLLASDGPALLKASIERELG
jgi:hypothetical protein